MAKKVLIVLALGVAGYVAAAGIPSPAAPSHSAGDAAAWFRLRGTVTRIVDGDTLNVRIGKKTEKVRLIGIDAPEVGDCFAAEAAAALRQLALNKPVILVGDRTQTRRDVYRRLLAYVDRPRGVDLGRQLLRQGAVTLYETHHPFARQPTYEAVASTASGDAAGLYGACVDELPPTTSTTTATATTTTATAPAPPVPVAPTTTVAPPPPPPASSNCSPSYPSVCIPPPPPDLDCGQVPHKNFRVVGPWPDPHRFDGDRDGIGCED